MDTAGTSGRRDFAPAARRIVVALVVVALLAGAGWWAWRQPFMAHARTLYEVSRMTPPEALPVPVDGMGHSGNARGTPTHLHYGICATGGALDPLPLLRAEASAPGSGRRR